MRFLLCRYGSVILAGTAERCSSAEGDPSALRKWVTLMIVSSAAPSGVSGMPPEQFQTIRRLRRRDKPVFGPTTALERTKFPEPPNPCTPGDGSDTTAQSSPWHPCNAGCSICPCRPCRYNWGGHTSWVETWFTPPDQDPKTSILPNLDAYCSLDRIVKWRQ